MKLKSLLLLSLLCCAASTLCNAPARAGDEDARARAIVTLLQVNDVYSSLPVDGGKAGGVARYAALVKQLKADAAKNGRHVVTVLPGDFLSPSVASGVFKGKQMVDALNAAGLDIGTLGNHEFDFGPDVLRERMKEARWKWVVSNVLDEATGKPVGGAAPYLLETYDTPRDSIKVGYIGLCLVGEEISKEKKRGLKLLDPFEVARQIIPQLKAQGADAIVAITHLDFADDRRLAATFPDITVICGGHEHFPIMATIGSTLISKAGSDARYLARIDLARPDFSQGSNHGAAMPAIKTNLIEKHYELIPITDAIPDDPATALVVKQYEDQLSKELDVVVGITSTPLDAVSEHVRAGESNLGDLITDAMRAATKSDVAFLNAGSVRSNRLFPAGNLTRRDLLAIHPFGGYVVQVRVTGATILQALEYGVGRLGESVGRFPQVSGIAFRADADAPALNRVRDVLINGAPLDLQKQYTLATNDYVLKGGDGYTMFQNAETLIDEEHGDLLISTLENYITARKTIAPAIESRIRIARDGGRGNGTPSTPVAAAKRAVILDTDMGIDSVMGLLYLLKANAIDLRAITIANGVAEVKPGARNALRILELTGRKDIPVALGTEKPLQGTRAFPSFWREQANNLGEVKLPVTNLKASREDAATLIVSTLRASKTPITLVAMGPLTNIALALQQIEKAPDGAALQKKIAQIIVMGGALNVGGNVDKPFVGIKNSVAEWNFYLDAQAAHITLEAAKKSGISVELLPLDATRALPLTPEFVDKIRRAPRDQTSNLLLALLDAVKDGIDGGYYYFWDTLAAVTAASPEVLGAHEERVSIDTKEGKTLGQLRRDPNGVRVQIGEEINRETFEERYLKAVLD